MRYQQFFCYSLSLLMQKILSPLLRSQRDLSRDPLAQFATERFHLQHDDQRLLQRRRSRELVQQDRSEQTCPSVLWRDEITRIGTRFARIHQPFQKQNHKICWRHTRPPNFCSGTRSTTLSGPYACPRWIFFQSQNLTVLPPSTPAQLPIGIHGTLTTHRATLSPNQWQMQKIAE